MKDFIPSPMPQALLVVSSGMEPVCPGHKICRSRGALQIAAGSQVPIFHRDRREISRAAHPALARYPGHPARQRPGGNIKSP